MIKSVRQTANNFPQQILLHAPGIHVGGGLHLLEALLDSSSGSLEFAQLDKRIQSKSILTAKVTVHWVEKSIFSRLLAEWRLLHRCTANDTVLCFHGLPPLFHLRGHVVVFLQNRLHFDSSPLDGFPFVTRLRLKLERKWAHLLSKNCDRYIVQTPSMAALVRHSLGYQGSILVCPFASRFANISPDLERVFSRKYDFVYVASGESHKNHDNLLAAWGLLADAGITPSLALTVDSLSYPMLANKIAGIRACQGLKIENLGTVASAEMQSLYSSSSALIFPSKVESFGLPLIEARQMGLPILASELDFVRDVVEPLETFDPDSPLSIARAVSRFLKNPVLVTHVGTAEEFLSEVFR